MKKHFLIILLTMVFLSCNSEISPTAIPEPVIEEEVLKQVFDEKKVYSSKDFFDSGFQEYKEYNVSKLTGAKEAWYGYWGPDEDSVRYYELRFYPDHSTALSDGTPFAEDATGVDANLNRKNSMWRAGLTDRKLSQTKMVYGGETKVHVTGDGTIPKYQEYVIYNNLILLCEGVDPKDSIKACWDLINILNK